MKKILTVSLFAIMAVSAANADIASTKYVGDQMNLAEKIANKVTVVDDTSVDEKYPSAKAVYTAIKSQVDALGDNVDANIELQLGTVTDQIDEASDKIQDLETALSADGATGKAIAAAQTQADKGVADAAAAKAAADAAQADADANTQAIAGLDSTYATDGQLSTAVSTLEGKITQASTAADTALTEALKGYSTTEQVDAKDTTTLNSAKAYTDELANGQVKTNKEAIAAINDGTNGILAQAKSYAEQKADEASGSASAVAGDLANYISTNNTAVQKAQADATQALSDAGTKSAKALTDAKAYTNTLANTVSQELNQIKTSAYATSGVTSETVAQVATNKTDIATINNSDVMKSGVNAEVVEKANNAMQEANLKALSSYTTNGCGSAGVMCSLVSDGGKISWEVVNQGK